MTEVGVDLRAKWRHMARSVGLLMGGAENVVKFRFTPPSSSWMYSMYSCEDDDSSCLISSSSLSSL